MEGESLVLFFVVSGGAVVLLFLVVLWQRALLARASQRLTKASRHLADKNDTKGDVPSFLEDAPFPILHADLQGRILRCSDAFRRLVGKEVNTLAEVAKVTGAQLAASKPARRHERVVLRTAKDEQLRHFSLVTWPVRGTYAPLGMMYALLEHTTNVQHSEAQHSFDQEILALQEELLKNMTAGGTDAAVIQELHDLTEFLKEQHRPHQHRTFEQFDLVKMVREALEEYRPHFRKRQVAVTSTLPREMMAAGYEAESFQIIQLLLAAVAEHAHPHSTVRLHVGRSGKHVRLSVSLPELRAGQGSLNDVFAFGSKAGHRQSQVRLALARLLLGHQQGNLTITVDDEEVVVAQVSFVGGAA